MFQVSLKMPPKSTVFEGMKLKRTSLRETTSFDALSVKIDAGVQAVESCQTPHGKTIKK